MPVKQKILLVVELGLVGVCTGVVLCSMAVKLSCAVPRILSNVALSGVDALLARALQPAPCTTKRAHRWA